MSLGVHIAVTGADGVGKSALVNKLAGFRASDTSAMITTTRVPIGVPLFDNVTCWDLPAPDTVWVPERGQDYVTKFQLAKMSVVVVVLDSLRISRDCLATFRCCPAHETPIFVVITKLDSAVAMANRSKPTMSVSVSNTVDTLKERLIEELRKTNVDIQREHVFVVSAVEDHDFTSEFQAFMGALHSACVDASYTKK